MLKDQTVSVKQNSFSITRFQPECYYEAVTMDFNPPFNLNKASNSIIPSFRKDKKFYTPAFILPRQQQYYEKNSLYEKTNFEERVFKAVSQSKELDHDDKVYNELNLVIPSGLYCQICKLSYENYFEHIKSEPHQKLSQENPANFYIADLCSSYVEKANEKKLPQKNKKLKKKIQNKPQTNHLQQLGSIKTRSHRRKQLHLQAIPGKY